MTLAVASERQGPVCSVIGDLPQVEQADQGRAGEAHV